jgi:hypothetical protein
MKAYLLAAAAVLTCGCTPKNDTPASEASASAAPGQQAEATPGAPPAATRGTIDWEAARTARAAASRGDQTLTAQAVTGGPPPAVPMLLPSGVVRAQNAGPPTIHKTDDGYFATYQTPTYDATVNGTNVAYATGGTPTAAAQREAYRFTAEEGGASLSFSRFGADYLISFECKQIDQGANCITEDQAKAFADSLFVAQTQ